MSVAAVAFDDRGTLLERLSGEDKSFAWEKVFSVAARETDEEVEAAAQVGEVSQTSAVTRVSRGMAIIKNATIGMAVLGAGLFLKFVIGAVVGGAGSGKGGQGAQALETLINSASSFFIAMGGAGALLMFAVGSFWIIFASDGGGIGESRTVKALDHAAANILDHAPISSSIKLIVPAPITYHLASALGPEGEVLAHITRQVPEVTNDEVHKAGHVVGTVCLGSDETSVEIAERFETLLDEVGGVEEAADAPYRTILADKGLDGEHIVEAEADLRLRAEAAHERRQLNSGVVASLNEQTLGQKTASALVGSLEDDFLLEPDVQEV